MQEAMVEIKITMYRDGEVDTKIRCAEDVVESAKGVLAMGMLSVSMASQAKYMTVEDLQSAEKGIE